MTDDLTVIIPYYNGEPYIERLLDSLPVGLPVVIVDDLSDKPLATSYDLSRPDVRIITPGTKGYFTGAVNRGIEATKTDVLILNQDVWFTGGGWLEWLNDFRRDYGLIGHPVMNHPAWPAGYIQGTFMYISRAVIDTIGLMNEWDYPLWGSTCEYQLRACRAGFKALPWPNVGRWLRHEERKRGGYGSAITQALKDEPEQKAQFIRTPPAVSIIVPCYNYGRYLDDCINSLNGGPTSLGDHPGQTLQSFEVIIVDDASQDETPEIGKRLADSAKGIRYIRLDENQGTPGAINAGIEAAYGRFITILSADDMREPWALDDLYRVCEADPQAVAYDDMMIFKFGQRSGLVKMLDYSFDRMLTKNPMHAGIMFPRAAWVQIGGYPLKMKYGREDWAFNVALGLSGYCGTHIEKPGYLYRREKQNRSLRNQGTQWRERFLMQMQALYPDAYAGMRPTMCCGKKSIPDLNNGGGGGNQLMAMSANRMAGADGMVLIEYTGQNAGTEMWQPTQTRRYEFGGSRRFGYVDKKDVPWFLERKDHRGSLFRIAPAPKEPVLSGAEAEIINPGAAATKTAAVAKPVEPEAVSLTVPDPAEYSITQLKRLNLSRDTWAAMLVIERQSENPRTGAIKHMESQLD